METVQEVREEALRSENEEKRARFEVPVHFECQTRQRLEGTMQLIESQLDDLVLVAKASLDSGKEWRTTKYWDLFRAMQKMIFAEKMQEVFPKLEDYADETEAFEDLQQRSGRVQEFYQAADLNAYFQSLTEVADIEEMEEAVDGAPEDPPAPLPIRRHTISQFPSHDEEEPVPGRRETWSGPRTLKRRKSEAVPRSSLYTIDGIDDDLVIVGTGIEPRRTSSDADASLVPQIIETKEDENAL